MYGVLYVVYCTCTTTYSLYGSPNQNVTTLATDTSTRLAITIEIRLVSIKEGLTLTINRISVLEFGVGIFHEFFLIIF